MKVERMVIFFLYSDKNICFSSPLNVKKYHKKEQNIFDSFLGYEKFDK